MTRVTRFGTSRGPGAARQVAAGEAIRCACCFEPITSSADAAEKHGSLVHKGDCEQQWGSLRRERRPDVMDDVGGHDLLEQAVADDQDPVEAQLRKRVRQRLIWLRTRRGGAEPLLSSTHRMEGVSSTGNLARSPPRGVCFAVSKSPDATASWTSAITSSGGEVGGHIRVGCVEQRSDGVACECVHSAARGLQRLQQRRVRDRALTAGPQRHIDPNTASNGVTRARTRPRSRSAGSASRSRACTPHRRAAVHGRRCP